MKQHAINIGTGLAILWLGYLGIKAYERHQAKQQAAKAVAARAAANAAAAADVQREEV